MNDIECISFGTCQFQKFESVDTFRKTCSDIEKWCADWRMLVYGGKTELILFNCEGNDFELPSSMMINVNKCHVQKTTKPLEVIIDSKFNYRDHSAKTRKQSEIGIYLSR